MPFNKENQVNKITEAYCKNLINYYSNELAKRSSEKVTLKIN